MNLITIILLGSALWVIYSLMESYNLLLKEIKELKRRMNASGNGNDKLSENADYDINKKAVKIKDNILSILKTLMNV